MHLSDRGNCESSNPAYWKLCNQTWLRDDHTMRKWLGSAAPLLSSLSGSLAPRWHHTYFGVLPATVRLKDDIGRFGINSRF